MGCGSSRKQSEPVADAHFVIRPLFEIKEGKVEEFKKITSACHAAVAGGTDKTLYYSFAFQGNQAVCREGYDDADGALEHIKDVGELLGKVLEVSEIKTISVSGIADDVKKFADHPLRPEPWTLLECSLVFPDRLKAGPDTHLSIAPIIDVPDGKLEEMKALCAKFAALTKTGTPKTLYYSFELSPDQKSIRVREGYVDADGLLEHLRDVEPVLKELGENKTRSCQVIGTEADIKKLKEPLKDFKATYFTLSDGGRTRPVPKISKDEDQKTAVEAKDSADTKATEGVAQGQGDADVGTAEQEGDGAAPSAGDDAAGEVENKAEDKSVDADAKASES